MLDTDLPNYLGWHPGYKGDYLKLHPDSCLALLCKMVCCAPSYYAHSLGPVRVARILACKGCSLYIASMDDLLSRVSA